MTDWETLIDAMRKEAQRIEEDSIHSAKGHFNTATIWNRRHYCLGGPATVLGALAGAAIIKNCPELAAFLSLGATILTALVTFLKPSERASEHKSVGDQYLALRNDARVFREIELLVPEEGQPLTDKIKALSQRRNELNQSSPEIPRKAFEQARKGIAEGEASHQADKGK